MKTKVIGTTDEVTTCDCCGRTDLQKTVVFQDEEGNNSYLGVVCASKRYNMTSRSVRQLAQSADAKTRQAKFEAECEAWDKFLTYHCPGIIERSKKIELLGGFAAARAKFFADCNQIS
jgi:hypothetical protein